MTTQTVTCSRCNGAGNITCYAHVAEGVCFSCKGTGKRVLSGAAAVKEAARTEAKAARKAAQIERVDQYFSMKIAELEETAINPAYHAKMLKAWSEEWAKEKQKAMQAG